MASHFPDYEGLDPRLFKAFVAAARTLSFTAAAESAAMTQSGVSQHVAKLEAALGVPLFERVNRSVLLTESGRELLAHIDDYMDRTSAFMEHLRRKDRSLSGTVSYAMPPSCLLSPHLPMLTQKAASHPEIELQIRIGTNARVYRSVLRGEVDFGFVTSREENAALAFLPFCKEEYVIAGADRNRLTAALKGEGLAELGFISYPGMRSCLDHWLSEKIPKRRREILRDLKVVASINSIEGAIVLLNNGVGVTAIPRHCIESAIQAKDVHLLEGLGPKKPVLNQIYIITLAAVRRTRRVEQVISWFLEMHP